MLVSLSNENWQIELLWEQGRALLVSVTCSIAYDLQLRKQQGQEQAHHNVELS